MLVDVPTQISIDRPVEDVAAFAGGPGEAPDWYVNIKGANRKDLACLERLLEAEGTRS